MTRRRFSEDGVTLVEVLIASLLTLTIMLMGFGILNTSTNTVAAVTTRSANSFNAREAIDALEANLRYATGYWVCGGTPATTTCAAPAAPGSWTRISTSTLFVTNASGGTQPTCDEWTITAAGLVESHVSSGGSTVTTALTIPGVMAWVPPLPSSVAQTTGFSSTLAGLVVVDLLVNSVAKATDTATVFDTSDDVSVHDFIAPDNLPTTLLAAPLGNC